MYKSQYFKEPDKEERDNLFSIALTITIVFCVITSLLCLVPILEKAVLY